MNLREGSCCPIAALARKMQCLGGVCPWYMPASKTHCLMLEVVAGMEKINELLLKLENTSEAMNTALKDFYETADALEAKLVEMGNGGS